MIYRTAELFRYELLMILHHQQQVKEVSRFLYAHLRVVGLNSCRNVENYFISILEKYVGNTTRLEFPHFLVRDVWGFNSNCIHLRGLSHTHKTELFRF